MKNSNVSKHKLCQFPQYKVYLVGGCYLLDQNMNVNYTENNRIRSTGRVWVIYDRAKIWNRGEGLIPTFCQLNEEYRIIKSEKNQCNVALCSNYLMFVFSFEFRTLEVPRI